MRTIKLMDCTLRDGGYLNDWKFGYDEIITVFERLVSAEIDIIEVGFLDERRTYDKNRSIFPNVLSVNDTFHGIDKKNAMVVGMIDYGTCSIETVILKKESFLEGNQICVLAVLKYYATKKTLLEAEKEFINYLNGVINPEDIRKSRFIKTLEDSTEKLPKKYKDIPYFNF